MSSPPARRLDAFAAASVLAALGVAWPILELLGDNTEFFLAHRSTKGEMLAVLVVLALALPVGAGLLAMVPGSAGRWISLVWIGLLGSVLTYFLLRRLGMPEWFTQPAALTLGASLAVALPRSEPSRAFFRYLTVSPLVLAGVFLLATPTGEVITEGPPPVGSPVHPEHPISVVWLLFDEFPGASLIHPDGTLNTDAYPNFARLAADGTWFPNAATVQQQTEHSIPAMLAGFDPPQTLYPVAAHYPNNLFTALARSHRMVVHEAITQLCPESICRRDDAADALSRAASLAGDLGVIAGHVSLPDWMVRALPPIDRGWGDFGTATDIDAIAAFNSARAAGDRRLPIHDLAEAIRADGGDVPTLYFVHALVPHNPWQYLPTGQAYPLDSERLPGSVGARWGGDEWLAAQATQRLLLQVGAVDRALGEVIAAMKEAGIYDRALLIVTADHGIAVRTNVEHWRRITPDTVGDIAAIPLFVKAPGRPGGTIDDRRALTVDILPTIADVLGFTVPWKVDGTSLFGPDPERTETTVTGPDSGVTFGVDGSEKLAVANRITEWFPHGDPWELRPPGAPDLVGSRLEEVVDGDAPFTADLSRRGWYIGVEPSGPEVPARVSGTLGEGASPEALLAIAVNGVIGAETRAYREDGQVWFQAMVPPELFVEGRNEVALAWLSPEGVHRVPME